MGRSAGVNLTKAVIEGLEPRESLYRLADAQTRGLEIQVTRGGVRSWVLRYRIQGHQKTYTLGRWPDLTVAQARKRAIELQAGIASDNDPGAMRKAERKAVTVAELVKHFKKEHLSMLKPSTRLEYTRLLDKRILPALGSIQVKAVLASDIAALLSKIRAHTPKGVEANRTRAVLSRMFTLAEVWGYRSGLVNPVKGQAKVPETKKDRYLSDKELVAVGAALRFLDSSSDAVGTSGVLPAANPHALAAFRLSLLTGMRKSEITGDLKREIPGLKWENVDLDAGTLRLLLHKTSRKVGARTVILCRAALEMLDTLPQILGNPYVIPGEKAGEALERLQPVWVRVRETVRLLQEKAMVPKKDQVSVADVTIHDLRRSFASLAARMGYGELFVAALLGHKAGSVTAGYARVGGDPLRDVAEEIGERMAALLDGRVDLEAEMQVTRAKAQARRSVKRA